MKKRQVLAVLVALLLAVGAGVYTYARYTFSRTGSNNVEVAAWKVALKQGETTVSDSFDLNLALSENDYVATGKIAPNRSATATLTLDLTGTEVATDIEVDLSRVTNLPTGMTITSVKANNADMTKKSETENVYSTTIGLNPGKTAISSNTVKLEIVATWANTDTEEANSSDTTFGGKNETERTLSIPVTVTAKQHIG